ILFEHLGVPRQMNRVFFGFPVQENNHSLYHTFFVSDFFFYSLERHRTFGLYAFDISGTHRGRRVSARVPGIH
ncbi:unnamed protein product, partial [Ectocarpus sp. 13 AM-2016]